MPAPPVDADVADRARPAAADGPPAADGAEGAGAALWFGVDTPGAAPGSEPGGSGWTVDPDVARDEGRRPPRPTRTAPPLKARLAGASRTTVAIVVVAAFVLVVLAATHEGPFRGLGAATAQAQSPPKPHRPDVRGTWTALLVFNGSLFRDTVHITNENLSTGVYSGTVDSPVGVQTVFGSATASTLTFTIRLGNDVEKGSAALTLNANLPHFVGTFANSAGGLGTITATRAR